MRIFGIDPGLAPVGYGVIEVEERRAVPSACSIAGSYAPIPAAATASGWWRSPPTSGC